MVIYLVPIHASDFAQGGNIGSGSATIPSGSGGACTVSIFSADDSDFADSSTTGSGSRGVLIDGGSCSGADGSGHVGGQAKFLVMMRFRGSE